ncbi:MAG: 1,4-dihydroxy-2-naphthoate polyprenyltransferase [bacterium]|nr:1,4-dihydroxy-2-naphthoate polyprenyltransferase [bacterium]
MVKQAHKKQVRKPRSAQWGLWLLGARPRTWPASVVPVAVGTAAVAPDVIWWRAATALVVAWAFQVGVNYANDYSDGIRGSDANRVGPIRLVGAGMASPATVRMAAVASFCVACVAGLLLVVVPDWGVTAWWLLLVGVACILAGWFYTGGKRPYGYFGLGELFVFVFFGLVCVVGTAFVQTEAISGLAIAAAVPVGLVGCALLMANNLRDIATDGQSGKLTLAVRLGERWAVWAYLVMVFGAIGSAVALVVVRPWAPLTLISLAVAVVVGRLAFVQEHRALLLAQTARLQWLLGTLLTLALAL